MKQLLKKITIALTGLMCIPFYGISQRITPELAFKAESLVGEGSIWHPDRKSLFWVDIEGKILYEYLPATKDCQKWTFNKMLSTVVPETESTVVVALQDEIIRVNLKDGSTTSIALINDEKGTLRCNDGKCDPEGRLWIGTMTLNAPAGSAALYTVSSNGTVSSRLNGVTNSNGIVWTADKKYIYYNDTPTGRVARYLYDPESGDVMYDGIAVTVARGTGSPDGMAIDKNGNIWVAQWGGFGVYCYNPQTGALLTKIDVPAPHVASCAFGGENLDILYITTARSGLSTEQLAAYPLSGSLFSCKPGVSGVKSNYFKKN